MMANTTLADAGASPEMRLYFIMHTTIADHVLELVHNAVEAGAGSIDLRMMQDARGCVFVVSDDGCGMDSLQRQRCCDPYATNAGKHPGRGVGMGLAFLKQLLEETGGRLTVESEPGKGTRVTAAFNDRHIDTPPLGDPVELFLVALSFHGDHELRIDRRRKAADSANIRGYELSRSAIRRTLGELEDISALTALRTFLRKQEKML